MIKTYDDHLKDAMRMYDVDTPDEKCLVLAKAVYKMAQKSLQLKLEKSKRVIQVIDRMEETTQGRSQINKCRATTLTGKRCGFKAVCGDFCRKHKK
tara:strand:+ start:36 stop:323 length:288 start_codon:yes stop_codon:yes gene_type:complete